MAPISSSSATLCALLTATAGVVSAWDHSLFTTSPAVYPSPNITGTGRWQAALAQANSFLAQLNVSEKAGIVTGTPGPCTGNIAPIPRLGFNGLCLQDGPAAIRQADYVSVFPAGYHAAASWDRGMIYQRGYQMASEFRAKGAHIALGPVVGPLGRHPDGGRNWEGMSPDPYLSGVAVEQTIMGMQDAGVQACVKHYIGNEQETQRNPSTTANGTTIEAISSNIDDRTMHELYLWPFANAVHSGASSFMCSYNRINGSYGCQNSKTLNGLLKTELGFQGYVMSDWSATHSGVASILAGLDMNMPGGINFVTALPSYWGPNLTTAATNGSVPMQRLNDMVLRVMTPYFYLKQNTGYPKVDPSVAPLGFFDPSYWVNQFDLSGPSNVDARDNHAALIRTLGAAGIVLLKNNGALPLRAPKNIGVFGDDAGDLVNGLYDNYAGGILAIGGGSGTGRFTYIISPLEAIKARAARDGALVQYITNNTYITAGGSSLLGTTGGLSTIYPKPPDVCIVFIRAYASEGADRESMYADNNGTQVVNVVAAGCPNTVVVYNGAAPIALPFANHPNVTAIVAAHMPGQEAGNSIVDVLYGDVNPSGHLPYVVLAPNDTSILPPILNSTALLNTNDPNAWQDDFTEGLLTDYRGADAKGVTPQFPFGWGLSYTNFSLSGLSVTPIQTGNLSTTPIGPIIPGGHQDLWDSLFRVSFTLTNTGAAAGHGVPQLYIYQGSAAGAGTPQKVLRGFEKVLIWPGQSTTVNLQLMRRDLSYWDATSQSWHLLPSGVRFVVGFHERDNALTGTLTW